MGYETKKNRIISSAPNTNSALAFHLRLPWKSIVPYCHMYKSAKCHRKRCVSPPVEFYEVVDGGMF